MTEPYLETIKTKPLANMHLHLTGAMSPKNLRLAAYESLFDLTPYEPLESHLEFDDQTVWTAAKLLSCTTQGLFNSLKTVVNKELKGGISYMEVSVNPDGMIRRGMTTDEISYALSLAAEYAKNKGTICKFKVGVNRKDGPGSISNVYDVFKALSRQNRVAIDLNGDERKYPTAPFISELRGLSDEGVPITVHAGEFKDQEQSMIDALEIKPARVAHAVAAAGNLNILKRLLEQNIIVEVCPTSSLRRGAVVNMAAHPVRQFVEIGIPVVVGTDDPAFFQNTIHTEYRALKLAGLSNLDMDGIKAFSAKIAGIE